MDGKVREYHFEVPGMPRGQARARARAVKLPDGRWVGRVHKDKRQELEEDKLGWAIVNGAPPAPHRGPISLHLISYYPIPASWPEWKKDLARKNLLRPTVKPDLSNVVKHIEDVMNGLFYLDDKQVCDETISKYYSDEPRLVVVILALDEPDYTALRTIARGHGYS